MGANKQNGIRVKINVIAHFGVFPCIQRVDKMSVDSLKKGLKILS